jgi:alpha-tubulin suppressor-like RCC1 family protein
VCWGANEAGQLGDATTTARVHATPVAGLAGVVQISAGAAHTCARRGDGGLWCWGSNTSGQLGDGVLLTHSGPLLARLSCKSVLAR